MYLEKSNITAAFTLCPANPVPPPLASTGSWCSRQTCNAATTSSSVRGITTPSGSIR